MDVATLGVKVTLDGVSQASAGLADFARAGASANQIALLTGASITQARDAVARFGKQAAETAAEAQGLALAEQEMAAAGVEVAVASDLAFAGLGRVRQGLTSVLAQATGTIPVLDRLGASVLSGFGIGQAVMIGALAGGYALIEIYKAWNESAATAQAAQDKLTESLTKWYEKQKEGPAGELPKQIDAMTEKVKALHKEMDSLMAGKFFSGVGAVGQGGSKADAWIRIFTAGSFTQMAQQFGVEVAKGTASMAGQITEGADAIAAAKKEATKKVADAAKEAADKADKAQRDRLRSIEGQWESLTPAANPVIDALAKQSGEMDKANVAGNRMVVLAQQDAALAQAQGDAHAYLANAYRAENEANAARAQYSGPALAQMLADIEQARQLGIVTIQNAAAVRESTKAMNEQADAAKKAADAAKQQVDTMLKDMQRSMESFFDNVLTKGITSFTSLFGEIKTLFLKMIAEMMAADIMKKLAGPIAGVMAGIMGTAATAGAQPSGGGTVTIGGIQFPAPTAATLPGAGPSALATAGKFLGAAGAGFGIGSMIGSLGQSAGVGETGSVLGGAAGGAAAGFAIGGPWGALAGGVAGAAGALLGFGHSASEAAKALLAYKTGQDSTNATLASWRAQITGAAADQKAAALFNLQVQYDQIQQTIQQTESGKKHEAERNKQLAEAASLYDTQKKAITDNTAAFLQNTGVLNLVSGYKLPEQNFNYAPPSTPAPPTPPPGGSGTTPGGPAGDPNGDGTAFNIVTHVVLDGKVVATNVVKNLRKVSQAHFGNTDQVADAMAFL